MIFRFTLIFNIILALLISCMPDESSLDSMSDSGKIILVNDSSFRDELRKYLILRITDYYIDSTGRKTPATDFYLDMGMVVVDLLKGKHADTLSYPGIYKVAFGCEDCGAYPEILLRSKNSFRFINIDKGGLTRSQVLDTIETFFNANSNFYNQTEKEELKKSVIRVLEDRPEYLRNAL